MVDTVEALVDGGRASAGPPLGPALGPKGVNIGQIIAAINEKTKAYSGMKVPVKILIKDDMAVIPLFYPVNNYLVKSSVKNLGINPNGDIYWKGASIEE